MSEINPSFFLIPFKPGERRKALVERTTFRSDTGGLVRAIELTPREYYVDAIVLEGDIQVSKGGAVTAYGIGCRIALWGRDSVIIGDETYEIYKLPD